MSMASAWADDEVWAPIPGGISYPIVTKYTPSGAAEGDDGKICWAATTSDLIEYWQQRYVHETGQPLPAGMPSGSADSLHQSQVFDTFAETWVNYGRGVEQGLYWYFSGCLSPYGQNDTTGAGGYWKGYCAQLGYPQTYAGVLERSCFPSIMYSEPSHTTPDSRGTFVKEFHNSGKILGPVSNVLVEKQKTNKWLTSGLGINPSTVSKWCANSSQSDIALLIKIARPLEVELDELLDKEFVESF